MRIIFFGTPDFAVGSLSALVHNNFEVVAVVTAPDKPAGRGRQLSESAVKMYAKQYNIPVLQPEKLKNEEFINQLQNFKADLFIVVAFRMLPEIVWNMPPKGTFNLHASLLPQYRGAAPINWAIINGEKETGVTTFFLQHEIDTGNIIYNERVEIAPSDNVGTLHDKLMNVGAALVVKTVNAIINNEITPIAQEALINNSTELKHAPKLFKDTCKVNWNYDVISIHNLIRGLSPYPAAFTEIVNEEGKILQFKIFESSFVLFADSKVTFGTLETDNKTYLKIAAINGWLFINELQLSGKKRMKIDELLRGTAISTNYRAI